MVVIDAMGWVCPRPVIEAKKVIAQFPAEGGVVKVLVDNQIACDNLSKFSASKGFGCDVTKLADRQYEVIITVGEGRSQETAPAQAPVAVPSGDGLVVAISQNKMGHGSDELGQILIKGFIYSISQLEVAPKAVVFFNSGVKLTLKDANTLADIQSMVERGTIVRVCGTCADYFQVKDQVAVGEICNMYDIVDAMSSAAKVINI